MTPYDGAFLAGMFCGWFLTYTYCRQVRRKERQEELRCRNNSARSLEDKISEAVEKTEEGLKTRKSRLKPHISIPDVQLLSTDEAPQ